MRTDLPAVLAAAAAALATLPGAATAADPIVIRDDRIGDLGVTPGLGRGYSLASNTFHSVCFDGLATTAASFDLDFALEHVDDDRALARLDHRYHEAEVGNFVRDAVRRTDLGPGAAHRYLHYLLAVLTVDSYYASIDESRARLGGAALGLLRAGNVLGFLAGCGTHYVRSIARRSYFLTVFSYAGDRRERDGGFEARLEESLRRLDVAGPSKTARDRETELSDQAATHDLRIATRSIGLRAETAANLIPFDLASYRATLEQAFKASQDDRVGRITAMEVVPWTGDPTFLAAVDLSEQRTAGATRLTRFERKQLLEDNAEFYVAISGAADQRQARVHRALSCKQALAQHILVGGSIPPALSGAHLVNHRTGERAPLSLLVDALSDRALAELTAAAHGPGDGTGGAAACIAELERSLTTRPHRAIPACEAAARQLGAATGSAVTAVTAVIDDYCLPELAE